MGDRSEIVWLSADHVERLNEILVADSGEKHIVMSRSLLEGAVTRPQNLFYYNGVEDIVTLGVRLMEAIGKNHCFHQGNKRTAFHAGISFMEINGLALNLDDTEENAALIERLILGECRAEDIIFRCRAALQAA